MIRRLLILAFTLSVVGNSLAAAAQVVNDECAGCCRPTKTQPAESRSIRCCYSECGEPGETQPASPTGVPGIERIYKVDLPIAASIVAPLEGRCSTFVQSAGRSIVQSTHIYLKTGTLLI
jgi:hypothetical protein